MARNNVPKPGLGNPPKDVMEWLNLFSTYLREVKGTENYFDPPATTIQNLAQLSAEVQEQIIPRYTTLEDTKKFPTRLDNTIRSELNSFSMRGKTLAPYYISGRIKGSFTGGFTPTTLFDSGNIPDKFVVPNKEYKMVMFRNQTSFRRSNANSYVSVEVFCDESVVVSKRFDTNNPGEDIILKFTTPANVRHIIVRVVGLNVTYGMDDYIFIYDGVYPDSMLTDVVDKITSQNDILVESRSTAPNMIGNGAPYSIDKLILGEGLDSQPKLVYDNTSPGSKHVMEMPVRRNSLKNVLVEFPFEYSFRAGENFTISFYLKSNIPNKPMNVGFKPGDNFDNDYLIRPTNEWQKFRLNITTDQSIIDCNLIVQFLSSQISTKDAKVWMCDLKVAYGDDDSAFCPSLLDSVDDGNSMTRLLSLSNPLCSIDENIYDVLYYRNGKTHSVRNVLHETLDGSEGWKVLSMGANSILFGTKKFDDDLSPNSTSNVISDNFAYHKDCNTNDSRCIYQDMGEYKLRIRMLKNELPFQNERGLEEWLKVNNTEIFAQLRMSVTKTENTLGKLNFDVYNNQTYFNCLSKIKSEINATAPSNVGSVLMTMLDSVTKLINVSGDTITGDHKYNGCGSIYINKAERSLLGTSIGKTYSLDSRITSEGIYKMEYKEDNSGEVLATIEVGPASFIVSSEKGYITLRTQNNELVFDGEKGIYTLNRVSLGDEYNQFSEAYVNGMVIYGARNVRPNVPMGLIGYMYDINISKPIWWNGRAWTDGLGRNV